MAVYAGCGCPAAGSALACNDDSCACASGCTGNYASRVQWVASAGSTYMLRVGGYGTANSGSGAIAVAAVPPLADVVNPANGHRYIAVNATSWSASEAFAVQLGGHLASIESADENLFVQQNFGNLLGDWGQFGTAADLDGDGYVSGSDLGILLGDWGPCT